jgi:hypothetical protein
MAELHNGRPVVGVDIMSGGAAVTVTGIATAGSTNTGATNAAAYSDESGAATGTMIGLLKGVYVQNAAIIALLTQIETNTAGT